MIQKSIILVSMTVFALTLLSCGVRDSQIKNGQTFVTEGWIDSDTFRVKAIGVSKKGLTNKYQRRATAKEAALIMAQKRIIEKFVGAAIEGVSGVADAEATGLAVSKEFSGFVKGGSIIKETYDDEQNCEIVYQVESNGLKKSVSGFVAEKMKK